jgi:hypothetical protein
VKVREVFGLRAALLLFLMGALGSAGCRRAAEGPTQTMADPHFQTNGTLEVTAKLLEIPEGAIFQRELYDYATVLKYQVLKVQRGDAPSNIIYVAQYNPFKPRDQVRDGRVQVIGGNVKEFRAGQVQHLALAVPVDEYYMGGLVNKYFGQMSGPIYWAVWTDLAR